MLEHAVLFVHPDRPDAAQYAEQTAEFFRGRGIRVESIIVGGMNTAGEVVRDDSSGVVITLGGDGTLLRGAEAALRFGYPLLGINIGTVGFLTEGEPEQLPSILEQLLSGDWKTEERGLLEVSMEGSGKTYYALNDAVVSRGGFARLIRVDATVNGEYLGTYTADGILAATPAGSTGYSLSAGGPVVAPGVPSILLTPICAHSFQRAAFVVPEDADIRFHLLGDRKQSAELQIDGRSKMTLEAGDTVRLTGAERKLRLIRLKPYRFFTLTMRKLNEWSTFDDGKAGEG